jgi:hypothetical protein
VHERVECCKQGKTRKSKLLKITHAKTHPKKYFLFGLLFPLLSCGTNYAEHEMVVYTWCTTRTHGLKRASCDAIALIKQNWFRKLGMPIMPILWLVISSSCSRDLIRKGKWYVLPRPSTDQIWYTGAAHSNFSLALRVTCTYNHKSLPPKYKRLADSVPREVHAVHDGMVIVQRHLTDGSSRSVKWSNGSHQLATPHDCICRRWMVDSVAHSSYHLASNWFTRRLQC